MLVAACCYYLEWYIISDIPTQAHSSSDAPFLICVKCKATVEIDKLDDLQMKIQLYELDLLLPAG